MMVSAPGRTHGSRLAALVLMALTVVLTACGSSQDAAAETAARDLVAAVAQRDGGGACALLAPAAKDELEQSSGEPCARAVLTQGLPSESEAPVSVQVFDTMAQVRFASGPVFLSLFDGKWLVVGAACTPVPGRPHDCQIQVS